jgi:protein-disulfide isomerase
MALGFAAAGCGLLGMSSAASAREITPEEIFSDPETPTAGNSRGDLTIVVFSDYNCQYCKKSAPDLDAVIRADGGVKLVYKDCPILTPASVHGARLALAARYQGRYQQVHDALMRVPGKRNPQEAMDAAIAASGVDVERLTQDRDARLAEIDALIARNISQSSALGFEGVPNFLIGRVMASGGLDAAAFRAAISQARELGTAR